MAGPHPCPRDREEDRHRDPERAGDEQAGQGERPHAQADVQEHHLRNRRALCCRLGDAARDVHDVRRAPHAEQGADDAPCDARGRRPAPAESSHRVTAEHHVEREGAHEQPQREQRRVPGQVDEQRHAQRETDEGERHERRELARVRLPARVEPEDQRGAEVKDRGQRQYEREGEEVNEDGNGDRRRPEARDAEHHVAGKNHEPHEDEHRHRDWHVSRR